MYTVGSLFSGIGGLDIGFERAGFEIKWQCEIDPFCQNILRKHWPEIPCHDDVTKMNIDNIEPVDVLIGGFPCQDVSIAGRKRGITGPKSKIWSEFFRIIKTIHPRWIFIENVPGLIRRGLSTVLENLANIGYDAEWYTLSASSVGSPQLRKRVAIMAYPNCLHRQTLRGQREDIEGNDKKGGHHRDRGTKDAQREKPIGIPREDPNRSTVGPYFSQRMEKEEQLGLSNFWSKPSMGRVAYGIPKRVDRIRGLGNSVVPQWAEFFARRLYNIITEREINGRIE